MMKIKTKLNIGDEIYAILERTVNDWNGITCASCPIDKLTGYTAEQYQHRCLTCDYIRYKGYEIKKTGWSTRYPNPSFIIEKIILSRLETKEILIEYSTNNPYFSVEKEENCFATIEEAREECNKRNEIKED